MRTKSLMRGLFLKNKDQTKTKSKLMRRPYASQCRIIADFFGYDKTKVSRDYNS